MKLELGRPKTWNFWNFAHPFNFTYFKLKLLQSQNFRKRNYCFDKILFRCKLCKFWSTNEIEQIKHTNIVHIKKLAKLKNEKDNDEIIESNKNYSICRSMEVLSIILKKCFFDFYCSKKVIEKKSKQ